MQKTTGCSLSVLRKGKGRRKVQNWLVERERELGAIGKSRAADGEQVTNRFYDHAGEEEGALTPKEEGTARAPRSKKKVESAELDAAAHGISKGRGTLPSSEDAHLEKRRRTGSW